MRSCRCSNRAESQSLGLAAFASSLCCPNTLATAVLPTGLWAIVVCLLTLGACHPLHAAPRGKVLNFSAKWCGPCQQMSPIVQELKQLGWPIEKIDVDQHRDISQKFNVASIPAFVLVVDGNEVERVEGACTADRLKQLMRRIPTDNTLAAKSDTAGPSTGVAAPPVPHLGEGRNPINEGNFADTGRAGGNRERPVRTVPFPAPGNGTRSGDTTFRGNTPEDVDTSVESMNRLTSSVRLRVKELVTRNDKSSLQLRYGSGTIIASRNGTTTILTSGHLLQNLTSDCEIEVDVFVPTTGAAARCDIYLAKVLETDAKADLGLVTIETTEKFPAATLARMDYAPKRNQSLESWGCDAGHVPALERVTVTALNHYDGPENIECTGAPIGGRSGGGLFDSSGQLVGVCIGADSRKQSGVYSAIGPVVRLLQKAGLVAGKSAALADGSDPRTGMPETAVPRPAEPNDELDLARQALESDPDAEVVVIVRPKNRQQPSRVMVVHSASSKLMKYLDGDSPQPAVQESTAALSAFRPASDHPTNQ